MIKNAPHFFWPMGIMKILERFAFHGVRVLLILYLTSDLKFAPSDAYELYGAVLSLYYGTAVIGGWWADKYLGTVNAVLIGSIFMMLGYIGLAFASDYFFLLLALSFFVVGNLFYKSTSIVLFGFNYRDHLDKRDRGFEYLFYFINIGAVLGMVICGFVGQYYGWRFGFVLTGIAMIFELGILIRYYKRFKTIFHDYAAHKSVFIYTFILGGGGILLSLYILYNPFLLDFFVPIFLVLIFSYLIYLMGSFNKEERLQSFKMVFLFFLTIIFLAFYEIKGSGMNLYLQYDVDRTLGSFLIPATWFQAISSLVIVLTGFSFIKLLNFIRYKGQVIKSYYRHCTGLIIMCVGYLIVFLGHTIAMFMGYKMGYSWFVLAYILMAFSELLIFPIMFSSAFKLAPKKHLNFFMGLISFSGFISNYLAAELAKISAPLDPTSNLIVSPVGFLTLLFIIVVILIIIPILMIVFRKKFSF